MISAIDESLDELEETSYVFPLVNIAFHFNEFVGKSDKDAVVSDLVLKLLNPSERHFNAWWKLWVWSYMGENGYSVPKWRCLPGAESTATLAYLCFLDLDQTAEVLLERNPDSSILENQLELLDTGFYNTDDYV